MITIVSRGPRCITSTSIQVEPVMFPDGTSQVFLPAERVKHLEDTSDAITIVWRFEAERELMDLASLATGLRTFRLSLELPYLPYARQDKSVTYEQLSTFNLAAFATLINALSFTEVIVHEPHNLDLTRQLFERCRVVHGAWTRYGHNTVLQKYPQLVFHKDRNANTGEIISTVADIEEWFHGLTDYKVDIATTTFRFHIVDDLVDSGRSSTQCSHYIKSWLIDVMQVPTTHIQVTLEAFHGALSKGLPLPDIDQTWCHHRLLHPCHQNVLLHTDGYKLAHMQQYPPGTQYIYSYMIARNSKKYSQTSFFGLQYLLLNYLQGRVTQKMVDEFHQTRESLLGPTPEPLRQKMQHLVKMQYLPLRIKAIPEGSAVNLGNCLVTVTNTHPDFFWLVGLVESLLLKLWYSCTVATYSRTLRQLCQEYSTKSCDNNDHVVYQIHDFGYRGASTEETAALGGASHLVHAKGTDTVPSIAFVKRWYHVTSTEAIGATVPGTEHSVMSSYGRDGEMGAYRRILELYPSGNVSIVSDTYDYWNVLTVILPALKDVIEARDGKLIIRPDSGHPETILLGDNEVSEESTPVQLGTLRILDHVFGSTVNDKGYKVLNSCVGVLYGDGMYYDRIKNILHGCIMQGFATSNITFGVGGVLLQSHGRDDMGFAFKATSIDIDGQHKAIFKDPATDHKKRSHRGLLRVEHDVRTNEWTTYDNQTTEQERQGQLRTVFEDGQVFQYDTFEEIQARANSVL